MLSKDDADAQRRAGTTQGRRYGYMLTIVSKFVTQRLFGAVPTGDHEKGRAADLRLVGVTAFIDR